MWFRNLLCYRLTQPLQLDLDAFETALRTKLARKPESQELTTLGFIPPFSKEPDAPVLHQVNGYLLVALRGHERMLPGSVVRDAVTEKVEEIEVKDNRKVYKKERDRIKDEIVQTLLPQAFVKKSVTYAAFDLQNSIVYVNASSPRKAEDLLSTVREVIGSLPVRPVSVKIAPTATFTDWVKAEEAATDFYVLSDCSLADTDEDGGAIEVKKQDLTSDEIRNLLNSGKVVTEISLAWQDKCSFVVNDKLQIKRLRFEDLLQEKAQQDGGEDAAGQFDASFLLMMSTLAELLPNLFTALGGEEIPQGI